MRFSFCFLSAFTSFLCVSILVTGSEAEKEFIIEVPYKKGSTWIWSWIRQWQDKTEADGRVFYQVCDVSSQSEPNKWTRSNVFHVGGAKRIDVTVQYAVSKCSSASLAFCKEYIRLAVHKTDANYNLTNPVPEPEKKPKKYEIFGTTSPSNLSTGSLSRNFVNTETYSFLTNSSTPNYYLAIQYQGGCFNLYNVTISYSVCPSIALPTGLIQLPRTIAPFNDTIRVSGSCAKNAKPLANNVTLYGHCQANGDWSSQEMQGECWCNPGYGKYLNGSGAVCKACPPGAFQDSPSGEACKPCPLNSAQDVRRIKCDCLPRFYRTKYETKVDNCTGQPYAPQNIKAIFLNATVAVLKWTASSNPSGRSDEYYEVECKKCENDGKTCRNIGNGILIYHSPSNSRRATITNLSAYTFYQFKVFAKNGVTHLAEKNGEKSKYAEIVYRTNEALPGPVLITVIILNDTTAFLSCTVPNPNGVITSYLITYYPVGHETTQKTTINATENNTTIGGLLRRKEYIFKVRARTKVGLGEPSSITVAVVTAAKEPHKGNQNISTEQMIGIAAGILALITILCIIVIFIAWRRRQKKAGKKSSENDMIPMASERLFVDPSNYSSPLEAMRSLTSEIELRNLQLKINIGEGEFAEVYKGILITPTAREVVAVKILKPTSSTRTKKDFIREASIMGQFKHPNVIELKGVVISSPDSPMMIVTEFMENGSLDHFLKSREGLLTPLQQVGIARGVANGMAYLTGMNFIHRDLAARNILVSENMASKIADFGLSRELDVSEDNPQSIYMTQGGKIPIRWTPPEAIRYKKYSSSSDVWSFGIVLWEIMAFAERPYWDWENEMVFTRVEEGYRLPAPKTCPKLIHDVMLDCWKKDTNARPKFPDIVQRLDVMIRSPDKMTDQEAKFEREAHTNLGQVTSVEEWLIEINMRQYTDKFTEAGLNELYQIALLDDKALKRIGITLVGHRHKIYKSICAMRSNLDQDLQITV